VHPVGELVVIDLVWTPFQHELQAEYVNVLQVCDIVNVVVPIWGLCPLLFPAESFPRA
jgi:hypothetical protein